MQVDSWVATARAPGPGHVNAEQEIYLHDQQVALD